MAVPGGEGCLHGADRLRVRAAADDPVEPHLVRVGGTGGEPSVPVAQLGDRGGLAADETVEPFIPEHARHLLGVVDLQRYQAEASRDDRDALVERAHAVGSLRLAGTSDPAPSGSWSGPSSGRTPGGWGFESPSLQGNPDDMQPRYSASAGSAGCE